MRFQIDDARFSELQDSIDSQDYLVTFKIGSWAHPDNIARV